MNLNKLRSTVPIDCPWALGASRDIKQKPVLVRLPNGKRIALFRKQNNSLHAIDDICPHRGASLSSGRVKNNCLECPYHGWLFNNNGELEYVPSNKGTNKPRASSVNSYNIVEHQDFIWLNNKHLQTPECIDFTDKTKKWHTVTGSTFVKGNWIDWISNGLDMSHINYVHDFADENDGEVGKMHMTSKEKSIVCETTVAPKSASIFTNNMQVKRCPVHAEFIFPNTTIIKIKLKEPHEFITYTSVLPITYNESLITYSFGYNINLFNPFFQNALNEVLNTQMLKTIREDEAIIQHISELPHYNINVACDAFQLKCLKSLQLFIHNSVHNTTLTK